MTVGIEERYKQAFEAHRHAADYRLKLLAVWGVVYAAFAAVFVWAQADPKWLSPAVTILWAVFTFFAWSADYRNRSALRESRAVGRAVEESSAASIPKAERFFSNLETGATRWEKILTHGLVIDASAAVLFTLLVVASIYLFATRGELPK